MLLQRPFFQSIIQPNRKQRDGVNNGLFIGMDRLDGTNGLLQPFRTDRNLYFDLLLTVELSDGAAVWRCPSKGRQVPMTW